MRSHQAKGAVARDRRIGAELEDGIDVAVGAGFELRDDRDRFAEEDLVPCGATVVGGPEGVAEYPAVGGVGKPDVANGRTAGRCPVARQKRGRWRGNTLERLPGIEGVQD